MESKLPETGGTPLRQRRRRQVLALAVVAALLAGSGYLLWDRLNPAPVPPVVKTAEIDPEAAAAIAAATTAVRNRPRDVKAWGDLALTLFAHDYYAESVECFIHAAELDPKDMRWPYFEGLARWNSDKPSAIAPLERAAALAANDPAPQVRVAEALLEEGRVDDALTYFQRALKLDPGHPRALLDVGVIMVKRGDASGGVPYLEAVAANIMTRKSANTQLAEAYARLGDSLRSAQARALAESLPEDIHWYDPILERESSYQKGPRRLIETAAALLDNNRPDDAERLLQDTLRQYPKAYEAHLVLAKLYLRVGHHAEAERALQNALRLKPATYQVAALLGAAELGQKQYDKAAEQFRLALQLKPDDPVAQFNLGHCLVQLGDKSGAIAAWKSALRFRPNSAEIRYQLGDLLVREGQADEGLTHLENAVRLAPQNSQYKLRLDEARAGRQSTGK